LEHFTGSVDNLSFLQLSTPSVCSSKNRGMNSYKKDKVNLIVIGSRDPGIIKGVFPGSVSQKVTHHAKCPVMIVK